MLYLSTAFLLVMIIFLLGNLTNKKNFLKKEKNSPFECGFDPFSISRNPFSIRFFMISIIFIIFDIEIIIILPFPIFYNLLQISTIMTMILIFLIILMGLIYEWKNGMIKWL
uniref:NADH-ubiquinone oxidoreductase chain 3 n=1 Tax=Ornithodoros waterbergensis TaxID=1580575 RepID=A0A1P8AGF9_9ACAR|nr:NADH dehydrogenase subunit 3 [Ornithodoros waterbergensis]AIZ58602.1 NADH dehydrogenase subunit 3 [Ornithodoros waterbergensis]AMX74165.1 NADH dehydrogenase subunit 3 [Ornithodoros waterbergensis]UYL27164.1 NADH dehydrogenase subunit 3 [Ornithodoros waterbergensis]